MTQRARRAPAITRRSRPRGRAPRPSPRQAPASSLPTPGAERSSRCRIPPARGPVRSATLPSNDGGTGCARRRLRSPARRRTRSECAAQKAGRTVPPTSPTGARRSRGPGGSPARCEGQSTERPRRSPYESGGEDGPPLAPAAGEHRAAAAGAHANAEPVRLAPVAIVRLEGLFHGSSARLRCGWARPSIAGGFGKKVAKKGVAPWRAHEGRRYNPRALETGSAPSPPPERALCIPQLWKVPVDK
jgi:hypothetical protein